MDYLSCFFVPAFYIEFSIVVFNKNHCHGLEYYLAAPNINTEQSII